MMYRNDGAPPNSAHVRGISSFPAHGIEPVFGPAPWPAVLSGMDEFACRNPCTCGDVITLRAGLQGLGDLGWTVCVGLPGIHLGRPGHEVITKDAMSKVGLHMRHFDALRHGVVHADVPVNAEEARLCTADPKRFVTEIMPGVLSVLNRIRHPLVGLGPLAAGFIYKQFAPHMQHVHSLRNFNVRPRWGLPPLRAIPETVAQTLNRMHTRIRTLTERIRRVARSSHRHALWLVGLALHTIQDSYSPGHADREGGRGRILNVRIFFPSPVIRADATDSQGKPVERHRFEGDIVDAPTNQPAREAAEAASVEYLRIVLPSIVPGWPPAPEPLDAFLARRLA